MELVQELVQVENSNCRNSTQGDPDDGKDPGENDLWGMSEGEKGKTKEVVEQEEIEVGKKPDPTPSPTPDPQGGRGGGTGNPTNRRGSGAEEIEVDRVQHLLQNQVGLTHQDPKVVAVVDKVIQLIRRGKWTNARPTPSPTPEPTGRITHQSPQGKGRGGGQGNPTNPREAQGNRGSGPTPSPTPKPDVNTKISAGSRWTESR